MSWVRVRIGIDPVALAMAGVDQAELAGIGDQHLVAEANEEAADPRRVRADLEDDTAARPGREGVLKSRGGGARLAGLQPLAVGIHDTVSAWVSLRSRPIVRLDGIRLDGIGCAVMGPPSG
jgi:hypothetical protein